MIKIRHLFLAIFSFILVFALSGCKFVLLDPKGIIALHEKKLLIISTAIMLLVVVPVIILTLVVAWRYRASNTKAAYKPEWAHSTLLEVIWWSVPCVIIGILGTLTWITSHTLDPYKPLVDKTKAITIQVIALEWKWLFIYPEQQIATVNFIQFPVGVPVKFLISAEGPMNSIQIPQLAGQIYAMAGMQTKLHLMANEAGDYQGISANFSGEGFSEMKFTARASTQAQFDEWVKSVKHSSLKLNTLAYSQLVKPSEHNAVQYFSYADPDIFHMVVMKSMMPMKNMAETAIQKNELSHR